ncbi:trace amine-associated receptor 13c-like [Polypterus senegalus]|uniref:trace amine-associated receptor 13c-like n=1 Tax=Polypterus senegalus TaxID=55291 RepID=UPI001964A780|nr:trace amine-associated receptor 13c-like [Polypterus senegalus]
MDLSEQQTVHYCSDSGNASCFREIRATSVCVILYLISGAVVMITIAGNLVVIISISHFKQLHTPTNLLVLSLAVADLLVGAIVMPFTVIQSIETCWDFGHIFCFFYTFCLVLLTSASVNNLVLIAVDRYFALCDPFFYSSKITNNLTLLLILFSWIIALCYTVAVVYFKVNLEDAEGFNKCSNNCLFVLSPAWGLIDLMVSFLLPCFAMLCLYTRIFFVVKKHIRAIHSVTAQVGANNGKQKVASFSERKAAKTLGIVVIVFFICWVPYHICTIIDSYMDYSVPSLLMYIFSWLIYINSGMNPIIYALFYPWFKKSSKLIITLKICSHASSLINLFSESH